MKNINLRTVTITMFLVILFSYNPPQIGYAQKNVKSEFTLPKFDTVSFNFDRSLIDSVMSVKSEFEVSKIECQLNLEEIEKQQALLDKLK